MPKLPKTNKKEVNKMIKLASKEGWRIENSKGGHIMCYSPDIETIVTISKTKGSHKVVQDIKSDFAKGGLKCHIM